MPYDEHFSVEDVDALPEVGPRSPDDIMTAPPVLLEDDDGEFSTTPLVTVGNTIDDSKDILEKSMVRALLRIMNSPSAKEADVIKAVGEAGELIGKKGKGSTVNVVRAENAQINQIMEKPELMDHIKKAADGIKKVASASNADIKVHGGGKGT